MKRIVITRPGGYDRLTIQDSPDLHAAPGQVIVNVKAVGVSYGECIIRMGLYKSAKKHGYPITPGFEFSGTVAEVGADVTGFTVGQHVFGVSLFNGYATQVSVPKEQLFPVPNGFSMQQAAAFPVSFLTAWYAAVEIGQAERGMTALVHSAAGGVGIALVQVLRTLGCTVIGVVGSTSKVETARRAGCHQVIDKSAEPLWTAAEKYSPYGFDLIFDSTGVNTLKDGYRHLKPTGRLISYGFGAMLPRGGRVNFVKLAWNYLRSPRFNPIRMADDNKSVMAFNLSFLFDRKDILAQGMKVLLDWLQQGKIKPLPVTEYAFADVAKAHRDLESGTTIGKLVLITTSTAQV